MLCMHGGAPSAMQNGVGNVPLADMHIQSWSPSPDVCGDTMLSTAAKYTGACQSAYTAGDSSDKADTIPW